MITTDYTDLAAAHRAGSGAFRGLAKAAGYGYLNPMTLSADTASRYHLPASAPSAYRSEWIAGFEAARGEGVA